MKIIFCQNDSYESLDNFSCMVFNWNYACAMVVLTWSDQLLLHLFTKKAHCGHLQVEVCLRKIFFLQNSIILNVFCFWIDSTFIGRSTPDDQNCLRSNSYHFVKINLHQTPSCICLICLYCR